MNRSRARCVVERKGEQCVRRHAGAGPAKADARRRQLPQIAQRTGWRRRRFHVGITRRTEALAQPDRIVRRVLLTARPAARAKMIRWCAIMAEPIRPSMSPCRRSPQGKFPERLPVVAEHPDLPENIAQHDQAAPDMAQLFVSGLTGTFQPVGRRCTRIDTDSARTVAPAHRRIPWHLRHELTTSS